MNMTIRIAGVLFTWCLIATNPAVSEDDSEIHAELNTCAQKADRSDRLECYDNISRKLAAGSAGTAAAVATASVTAADDASAAAPEPDDVNTGIPVTSVSCQRGHNNEYIFTFDNGETWKQVSSSRLKLSDCEFSAVIEKDFFGYKMTIIDENVRVRVKRLN